MFQQRVSLPHRCHISLSEQCHINGLGTPGFVLHQFKSSDKI